jgi:hypothetical protein
VEAAVAKGKLTFNELAPRAGTQNRALIPPLEVISGYCKRQGWPPLTSVVVNEAAPVPVDAEGLQRVYDYDWSKVKNPFEVFMITT